MSCALVSLLIYDVCLTLTLSNWLSLTQIFSILADREKSKGTGHNMRDKSTIKRLQMYRGGKPKRFVQMSITLVIIYSILLLVVCQNECHIDYKYIYCYSVSVHLFFKLKQKGKYMSSWVTYNQTLNMVFFYVYLFTLCCQAYRLCVYVEGCRCVV